MSGTGRLDSDDVVSYGGSDCFGRCTSLNRTRKKTSVS